MRYDMAVPPWTKASKTPLRRKTRPQVKDANTKCMHGIAIHAFIHGYSRLVTAIRASHNNRASTVLDLFREAVARSTYGLPSRVHGDRGEEN